MKYIIFLMVAVLGWAATAVSAQESNINQRYTDLSGNQILLGICTPSALQEMPFSAWFRPAYEQYAVDSATCRYVAPLLNDKRITLFMGTWCGDSRREVPRLLKILDCCGFPPAQLTLVMVSNQPELYKQSPGHEEAGRGIRRVPTLIIESRSKELGRIIELPVVSLEKDLLSILRGNGYRPQFADKEIAMAMHHRSGAATYQAGR